MYIETITRLHSHLILVAVCELGLRLYIEPITSRGQVEPLPGFQEMLNPFAVPLALTPLF